jgi:hypothetical protein
MARKNAGKFPILAVQTAIKGSKAGEEILAHGTHDMPVWGSIFSQSGQQRDLGDMRVMALLKYLEGIQAK